MASRDLRNVERLADRTTKRVAEMSDEARAEVARELAGRQNTVADPRYRVRAETADGAAAAEIARITAELHRTERRLDRIERSFVRSRYQRQSEGPPTGRYARLLSRAARLERRLNALR